MLFCLLNFDSLANSNKRYLKFNMNKNLVHKYSENNALLNFFIAAYLLPISSRCTPNGQF